ncbi:phage regulatory protein/antirepressor Ant [Carnobacterium sp. TMP28]|uniref:phage regulatory protein/antirepressor Ant n=1 Tax=Carnobacterium sp. TMP28 TaxID=3397060 RepID=UPI0039E1B85E
MIISLLNNKWNKEIESGKYNMTNLIEMKPAQTIESREVAEMLGKEHSKLMRDIRGYSKDLAEANIGLGDFFVESAYQDANNQSRPCFLLTKQGCEMAANKLTGKKGTLFTARYVQKFNQMEQSNVDSYMIADPIARAKQWIEEQQQTQLLIERTAIQEQLIAEYEPKITYLDEILNSKNTMTITQIAADYGMSGQELNRILWNNEIQRKEGGQWVLYRKHMNNGYTKSKTVIKETGAYPQTKWTQKGRIFIHNLLESLGYLAVMDNEQTEMEV